MRFLPILLLTVLLDFCCGSEDTQRIVTSLQTYNITKLATPGALTVSGLSAGAYMSVQMHVAFSSIVTGAAIFAGGPFACAQGSVTTAETTCMNALPFAPNPSTFVAITKNVAQKGLIDDYKNLVDDRVYMFSGTMDTVVHPPVMHALYSYYKSLIPGDDSINFMDTFRAEHTQPTNEPQSAGL